jgi:hypothetical protein
MSKVEGEMEQSAFDQHYSVRIVAVEMQVVLSLQESCWVTKACNSLLPKRFNTLLP